MLTFNITHWPEGTPPGTWCPVEQMVEAPSMPRAYGVASVEGRLPDRLAYLIGDGRGSLPIERVEVEDEGTRTKRDASVRDKVEAVLREHTRAPAPDDPEDAGERLTKGRAFAKASCWRSAGSTSIGRSPESGSAKATIGPTTRRRSRRLASGPFDA